MLDPWFIANLACPLDQLPVAYRPGRLCCRGGHEYPVVDGVPVMLIGTIEQTIGVASASLRRARSEEVDARAPELHLESLGISDEEKSGVLDLAKRGSAIDPVVAHLVAATNGLMYKHLIGALDRYPIPELPMPPGGGDLLLDVGCSWGRWYFAAHARGYQPVGIDPSLGAVMAARRVADQLNIPARFVVGDARYLPFPAQCFSAVYSYSVLQHFSPANATRAVAEIGRVLAPGGRAKVQMPTVFGVRCLYHQIRRGFRTPAAFEVRYWTVPALRRLFGAIGATRIEVEGFFGIGMQRSDAPLMPRKLRWVLRVSALLTRAATVVAPLRWIADSVFAEATKPPTAAPQ